LDGIINVYKEKGYTSHDVVARLRGITGERHIGHTGTLDPAASGVLPVCLGTATKACELLTDKGKVYETVLLLGIETSTEDITGEIVSVKDPLSLSDEEIIEAIESFTGDIFQVPPMFSATRVNGVRSYSLARQGKTIEREAKKIHIDSIKLCSSITRGTVEDNAGFTLFEDSMLARYPEEENPEEGRWHWENNDIRREENRNIPVIRIALKIACEKGTYIRTVCADIGKKLGCGGCMERLLRTASGDFSIKDSHSLAELEEMAATEEGIQKALLNADRCFNEYPALHMKEKYDSILMNGNVLWMKHFKEFIETPDPINRVYDSSNEFRALYEWIENRKLYKPVKVFISNKE